MQYLFFIYITSNMGDFSKHRLETRTEGGTATQMPKPQKYVCDCHSSHSVHYQKFVARVVSLII